MEFPQKTRNGTAFWPGNSILCLFLKSITSSNAAMEFYKCISKYTDFQNIHSPKYIKIRDIYSNMKYNISLKWNKPDGEGQIPYDLTFNWKIISRRQKQTKYNQRHWS